MAHEYTVASAAQLVGAKPPKRVGAEVLYQQGVQAMDHANRENSLLQRRSAVKKGSHSRSNTIGTSVEAEPGTDIFTHSRHASWECSPNQKIPESVPRVLRSLASTDARPDSITIPSLSHTSSTESDISPIEPNLTVELLKPVAYSPPTKSKERSPSSSNSETSDNGRVGPDTLAKQKHRNDIADTLTKLSIVTNTTPSHKRDCSNSSTSSSLQARHGDAIYFTPIDMGSKVFLSSAIICSDNDNATQDVVVDEDDGDLPTPRPIQTRPRSQIYVGPPKGDTRPISRQRAKEKFGVNRVQLDHLVTALARSRMVQKDVRKHWWDSDDIPDDDSLTSVSVPTLTSASTLYSHPNQRFEPSTSLDCRSGLPFDSSQKPDLVKKDVPYGGVALTDPKIHGSPIRFISKDYRSGSGILSVGSCSFLTVPYGTDVECTLRIVSAAPENHISKIMLQCANQVVDRTTGKRAYLLVAEIDVTEHFTRAAIAEFAAYLCTDVREIDVVDSPLTPRKTQSPEIDWVALADELQYSADTADVVDSAIASFSELDKGSATLETLALLVEMDSIKDQHSDFLILKPTAHHHNGAPATIKIPYVSQRLFRDWYEESQGQGRTEVARRFQAGVVGEVGVHAAEATRWECEVKWKDEDVRVDVVPLREGVEEEGRAGVWVCFVRGVGESEGED